MAEPGYDGPSEVDQAEEEDPVNRIEMFLADAQGICEEIFRVQRSPMLMRVWTKIMEARDWLNRVNDV